MEADTISHFRIAITVEDIKYRDKSYEYAAKNVWNARIYEIHQFA